MRHMNHVHHMQHMHMHMHMRMRMHMHMHAHVHVHVHTCACACTCALHMHMHTCACACAFVQIPCALIYYLMAVFVARSNLLGRIEPGPPTKPLQYRLVFGVYLPLHMLLRFLVTALIYMDVPLLNPNEQPFGNLSVEHWAVTPQTAFHSVYALFGAAALLILIPLGVRRHALRKGVLTPWQLFYLWVAPYTFSLALEDLDFSIASRVQAGIQYAALGDSGEPGSTFVVLPNVDELHCGGRFRAPNGLDLLAAEASPPLGGLSGD